MNSTEPVYRPDTGETSGERLARTRHPARTAGEEPEQFDFLPKKRRIFALSAAAMLPFVLLAGALLWSSAPGQSARKGHEAKASAKSAAAPAPNEVAQERIATREAAPAAPVPAPAPAVVAEPGEMAQASATADEAGAQPDEAVADDAAPPPGPAEVVHTQAALAPPQGAQPVAAKRRTRHHTPGRARRRTTRTSKKTTLYRNLDF